MRRAPGLFLVLEGPDKSGKSTQARLLVAALEAKGLKVLHSREPGGTAIAEGVRRVLLDPNLHVRPLTELFLYEAARAQHVQEKILPALQEGKVVLCERFTMSTDAYQGVARSLGIATTKILNRIATGGLQPDLTIVLDIPVAEFDNRDRRRHLDRLERENAAFRRKVRDGYRRLSRAPGCTVVDGRRPADEVHRAILARVERLLKIRQNYMRSIGAASLRAC